MMQIFSSEAKAMARRNELSKRDRNQCYAVLRRFFGDGEVRFIVGKWVNRGPKRVFIALP